MDVGAMLQSARERRGLSLDDLAHRTKISVRVLRALEHNAIDTLPPGIFMRGFLRAYAKEVGLDPGATVEAYLAQFEPVETSPQPAPQPRVDNDPAEDVFVVNSYGGFDPSAESGSEAGKAIVIALVSLAFVAYLSMGTSGDPVAEPPPAEDTAAAVAQPGNPAVLRAADLTEPVATTGQALEIEIRPFGPCWVEAVVDGSRRVYRLMSPGDRESLTVHEDLVLRVGDPSAFAFSINGRPGQLPGPGRTGQPITIRVGLENVTEFLAP